MRGGSVDVKSSRKVDFIWRKYMRHILVESGRYKKARNEYSNIQKENQKYDGIIVNKAKEGLNVPEIYQDQIVSKGTRTQREGFFEMDNAFHKGSMVRLRLCLQLKIHNLKYN